MDNNVLVAAGVGVAMLGGLFVFISGKRKGPVCLPESFSSSSLPSLQLDRTDHHVRGVWNGQVFLDKTRQKAPLLQKTQVSCSIIPVQLSPFWVQ